MNGEIRRMDYAKSTFTRVSNDALKKIENKNDALVYMALCKFANNKTLECFPSLETLASASWSSKSTVQRSLKSLEELGLIAIVKRRDKVGQRASNLYILLATD